MSNLNRPCQVFSSVAKRICTFTSGIGDVTWFTSSLMLDVVGQTF